ncbi:MAG: MBL fold metallo-hydrolase [Firmicutes bacterium]|nr:MBL fold metallo-hydrolase [Bacillota bacterium]
MLFKGFRLETVNYDLLGGYVNSYILETEKTVYIIDANVGSAEKEFARALESFPVREKPVVLLCTHGHWDHVGLAGWLKERYGAKILAPEGSARFMQDPGSQLTALYDRFAKDRLFSREISEIYFREFAYPAAPDGPVKDGDIFSDKDFSLKVIATPGHWGDCVSFFEENSRVVFCGDAVQGEGLDGNAPFYINAGAYLASLYRIRSLAPMSLLGGHMSVAGPQSCMQFIGLSEKNYYETDRYLGGCDLQSGAAVIAEDYCRRFGYSYGIHAVSVIFAHMTKKERTDAQCS